MLERRILLLACGVGIAAGPAAAQDTRLDEVVVTANRIAAPRSSVGSSVTVIGRDEIERMQATDVAEVLRRVNSIGLSRNGGAGQFTSVRIRGSERADVLVMVDGVEVADVASTQQAVDFGTLLVADIERIEVVRGPQSTLYGGDAVAGVIHIFTRKGASKPRSSVTLEGGSYGTAIGKGSTSGRVGKFGYALGISARNIDGFSSASERNGAREKDGLQDAVVNGRFDVQASDNLAFDAVLRRSTAEVDYDGFGPSDDIDNVQKTDAQSGRLAMETKFLGGSLRNTTSVSYAEIDRDDFDRKRKINSWDSWKDKLDDQLTYDLSKAVTLVGGLEVERDRARFNAFKDSVTSRAAFGEVVLKPADGLDLTFGGRVDDHGTFGSHATYRTSASYLFAPTDSRLHGSIGTGFRAPSLNELFGPADPFFGPVGNAALRPEESRGYDLGVEQTLWGGRAVLDVTGFASRTSNLIQFVTGQGFQNVASSRTFGIETDLKVDITDDFGVSASHTYLEARDNTTDTVLLRRPKHSGRLGVFWDVTDEVHWDVDLVGESQRADFGGVSMGGYARVDTRISYDVSPSLRLFGRIENLFDKDYEVAKGYGTAGLSGYAGMTVTF